MHNPDTLDSRDSHPLRLPAAHGGKLVDFPGVRNRLEVDERTRAMLDATPLACSLWDEKLHPLDCNREALAMFDLASREEFFARCFELMPRFQPDGASSFDKLRELNQRAMASGREQCQWMYRTTANEPLPAEMTLVRVAWGEQFGIVRYARDLRPSLARLAQTREADERAQLMLDTLPLGCAFFDENLQVIDCNHECLVMFGLSSKEEYQRRFFELSPEFQPNGVKSADQIYAHIRIAFEHGGQHRFEWLHRKADGAREFLTEVTLVRVRWKNGFRVTSFMRDVSAMRAAEKRRREAEARSRELEVQTRAARVASESKSAFLATMSHEIRTPMNAIIGMADLMRTDNLDETQREFVADIRNMSHSLLHIINGVLDFSKIEAGKLELTPVHFDLLTLFDSACSVTRFAANAKGLRFTANIAPDVPRFVFGDDVRIRQVVTNVLNNAVKYTREGEVDFRVERIERKGARWLRFSVADTGIGIRKEDFAHLFHAFTRLDETANRTQIGTGLGLAITRNLLHVQRGSVTLDNHPEGGLVATVVLPRV